MILPYSDLCRVDVCRIVGQDVVETSVKYVGRVCEGGSHVLRCHHRQNILQSNVSHMRARSAPGVQRLVALRLTAKYVPWESKVVGIPNPNS